MMARKQRTVRACEHYLEDDHDNVDREQCGQVTTYEHTFYEGEIIAVCAAHAKGCDDCVPTALPKKRRATTRRSSAT